MSIIWNTDPAIGFCTVPLQTGGFAFTLTTKLAEYLREAERRYGVRNMEWTILGMEFCGDIPCVWFPNNEKLISIMLTKRAASDWQEALFQISHEVIHLLEPAHVAPTNVFEEGLATLFSHEMSAKDQLGKTSQQASYLEAEKLLKDLLNTDSHAIQRLRQTRKPFFNLGPDDVLRACPNVATDLAAKLTAKFTR